MFKSTPAEYRISQCKSNNPGVPTIGIEGRGHKALSSMVGTRSRAIRRGTSRKIAISLYTHERPWEKPETSFETCHARIARERGPSAPWSAYYSR